LPLAEIGDSTADRAAHSAEDRRSRPGNDSGNPSVGPATQSGVCRPASAARRGWHSLGLRSHCAGASASDGPECIYSRGRSCSAWPAGSARRPVRDRSR
jgi:hypothetical protein